MNAPRAMTSSEQGEQRMAENAVRSALSVLRLTRITDEDVAVAKARLENWLTENSGRWVK